MIILQKRKNMRFLPRLGRCLYLLWDLIVVSIHIVSGVWRLSKLDYPMVTIFGGSKVLQDNEYAAKATQLAQLLVDHGISILTGGGPGIMQAANCGARNEKYKDLRSIGIGVRGLDENLINICAQEYITLDYFFARKWLLTQYSTGFAVFPGGFGTLDELAEVVTLMQTKKLSPAPIVMIGVDYWKPFMSWVHDSALKNNMLKPIDIKLLTITDDINEAFNIIYAHQKSNAHPKK